MVTECFCAVQGIMQKRDAEYSDAGTDESRWSHYHDQQCGYRKVLKTCPVPVVLVDRTLQNVNEKAVVKSDHYKGGYLAAEHLVQCGCKILCV